ncbi:MAG: hypothetical protein JXR76_12845 [Deltaproteobacteria bacterium]|nr:hypothetical protein [Deltaproteobacteria bacterium]
MKRLSDAKTGLDTPRGIAIGIAVLSSLISFWLVWNEMTAPPFCPRLLHVPACVPVFVAYVLVTFAIVFKKLPARRYIYWGGTIIGLAIAIWFSTRQLLGLARCPTLPGIPIPLCFASLLAFTLLMGLRPKQ